MINALEKDAIQEGIEIYSGVSYKQRLCDGILTSKGPLKAHFIVNAAGLYADRIALDFECSENYRLLPFKGLYLYSDEPPFSLKTHLS